MSYSTFYGVKPDGSVHRLVRQHNSFRFSPRIWDFLFEKYLKHQKGGARCFSDPQATQDLWDLQHNPGLRREERLALLATFDVVWIPKEMHREVAMACSNLGATLPFFDLDDAMRSGEFIGWCSHGTSVSESQWKFYETDADAERGESMMRNAFTGPAYEGRQMPWRINEHPMLKVTDTTPFRDTP